MDRHNTLVVLIVTAIGLASAWDTKYDETFTFTCPPNQALKEIMSDHDDYKEDRKFLFKCSSLMDNAKLDACAWSGYVNEWDEPMMFECASNKVIAGVYSEHNNRKEDRKYKFLCCQPQGFNTSSHEYTEYVNEWNEYFDYVVPKDRFIAGVKSIHENRYEDRRFKFQTCKLEKTVATLGK